MNSNKSHYRSNKQIYFLIVFFWFVLNSSVFSQNRTDSTKMVPLNLADSTKADTSNLTEPAKADTSDQAEPAMVDSSKLHSPRLATIFSAVCPGLGQIYNRKYWKAPIIYAGIGVCIYYIITNRRSMRSYRDAYSQLDAYLQYNIDSIAYQNKQQLTPPKKPQFDSKNTPMAYLSYQSYGATNAEQYLLNGYNYYQRYMWMSGFICAGIYVLNIIDACVDGYFYSYDISNDLSMRIEPTVNPSMGSYRNNYGMKISFRF